MEERQVFMLFCDEKIKNHVLINLQAKTRVEIFTNNKKYIVIIFSLLPNSGILYLLKTIKTEYFVCNKTRLIQTALRNTNLVDGLYLKSIIALFFDEAPVSKRFDLNKSTQQFLN